MPNLFASDWTSRRRVEAALNHREADRVPYDLGGTILTGIHRRAYRRLRDHLGLPKVEIEIDGGVGPANIAEVARAGVDTFVAGSAVFGAAKDSDPQRYNSIIAALRAELAKV